MAGWSNDKLLDKWHALQTDYTVALSNYNHTGNGEGDFYLFCKSRKDLYYLRLILETKGDLNSFVLIELPENAQFETLHKRSLINDHDFDTHFSKLRKTGFLCHVNFEFFIFVFPYL